MRWSAHKFKLVMGYPGTGAMNIAMERGEVHGRAGSWNSFRGAMPHWVEKDLLANLAVIGLDREPELPDVPLLTEFISDPADRLLMEVVASTALFAHVWLAPPGVPAERVAALREAFAKTLKDPEMIAQMKKRRPSSISSRGGSCTTRSRSSARSTRRRSSGCGRSLIFSA